MVGPDKVTIPYIDRRIPYGFLNCKLKSLLKYFGTFAETLLKKFQNQI